jgi:hypothetical protein
MGFDDRWSPALDLFWEEADLAAAAEHPLQRELAHRLDVLARYERLLAEAQSGGSPAQIATLTREHRRQLQVIEVLDDALRSHDAQSRHPQAAARRRPGSS